MRRNSNMNLGISIFLCDRHCVSFTELGEGPLVSLTFPAFRDQRAVNSPFKLLRTSTCGKGVKKKILMGADVLVRNWI